MVRIGKLQVKWNGEAPQKDIKTGINEAMAEVSGLEHHVKTLKCPACLTQKLHLISVELGPEGWQAAVRCDCRAAGILTQKGMHFDLPLPKEVTK